MSTLPIKTTYQRTINTPYRHPIVTPYQQVSYTLTPFITSYQQEQLPQWLNSEVQVCSSFSEAQNRLTKFFLTKRGGGGKALTHSRTCAHPSNVKGSDKECS